MNNLIEVNVNGKIASEYGHDSFIELLGEALDLLNMSEAASIVSVNWDNDAPNNKTARRIIAVTLGLWAEAIL